MENESEGPQTAKPNGWLQLRQGDLVLARIGPNGPEIRNIWSPDEEENQAIMLALASFLAQPFNPEHPLADVLCRLKGL